MVGMNQIAAFIPAQSIGDLRSDEERWIEQARAGNVDAFNRLVVSYQDTVYQLACRLLPDRAAAADATQEAFIAAYRRLDNFHAGSFKSWLYRIVINKCYDALRVRRRHPTLSLDELDDDRAESFTSLKAAHHDTPEAAVQRRELADLLQRHIAGLPIEQCTVVVLRDVHDLSYEEIAAITQLRLGTVRSRLSRGRARLRHGLEPLQSQLRST